MNLIEAPGQNTEGYEKDIETTKIALDLFKSNPSNDIGHLIAASDRITHGTPNSLDDPGVKEVYYFVEKLLNETVQILKAHGPHTYSIITDHGVTN